MSKDNLVYENVDQRFPYRAKPFRKDKLYLGKLYLKDERKKGINEILCNFCNMRKYPV